MYQGEPSFDEMIERDKFWKSWSPNGLQDNHLRISHPCPNCNGHNTEWVRQQWSICYDCLIAFDYFDGLVYNVEEYNTDPRIASELIPYMDDEL